ncbi:N-6 DNA methylase [Burkholderia vietnamiensis]|uniref:N-6 DNA methylase n=1 Tax=Burkholderia vietnamiensis TaxID=60552 RepID=UPI001CF26DC6|nr:N-6 DNA methylase [Burkholderia vietnamiensis]MCA8448908.1 SAM-dependent methyltransferase [Burkholderia vietnamiensis]
MKSKTTKTQHPTTPGAGFTKRIERFAQRNPIRSSAKAIIDDLVQLQFNTLSSALPLAYAGTGVAWFDDRHLIALNEYRDHPEAWAELVALSVEYQKLVAASAPFTDLLSDFYGASIAQQQAAAKGQHMTPADMADLLAPFASGADDHGPRRLGDPTCGSGALLLAELRNRFLRHGKAGVANMFVLGNDIDPALVKLATVQIALSSWVHKVPLGGLMVHHANLITEYTRDKTLVVAIHPNIAQAIDHGHGDDVATAMKAAAAKGKHLMAMGRAVESLISFERRGAPQRST